MHSKYPQWRKPSRRRHIIRTSVRAKSHRERLDLNRLIRRIRLAREREIPQFVSSPQRVALIRATVGANPAPARIYIQIKQRDKINFPKSALPTIHKNFPLTRQGISVSFYQIMAKIDLELVKVVLQRSELDAKKIAQIIEDITFESKPKRRKKKKNLR